MGNRRKLEERPPVDLRMKLFDFGYTSGSEIRQPLAGSGGTEASLAGGEDGN